MTESGHELLNRCRTVLADVDERLRETIGSAEADQWTKTILATLTAFSEPR